MRQQSRAKRSLPAPNLGLSCRAGRRRFSIMPRLTPEYVLTVTLFLHVVPD